MHKLIFFTLEITKHWMNSATFVEVQWHPWASWM